MALDAPDSATRLAQLITLTERQTRLTMVELRNGANYRLTSPDRKTLVFVTDGAGTADGVEIEKYDGAFLEKGEAGTLATTSRLEVLLLGFCRVDSAEDLGLGLPAGEVLSRA